MSGLCFLFVDDRPFSTKFDVVTVKSIFQVFNGFYLLSRIDSLTAPYTFFSGACKHIRDFACILWITIKFQ